MATGRTKPRWTRVYVDGYDMSGYTRSVGPLDWTCDEVEMTCLGDTVKCYLPAHVQANVGTLNAVFDNTLTVGVHTVLRTAGAIRTVLVAYGIRAIPAEGDPCFGGQFTQGAYTTEQSGGVYVNVPFMGTAGDATSRLYGSPWGTLLHANTAETAVNADVGFDNLTGAATAKGGYFLYQILSSNAAGTVTLSVQDAAINADGSFALLAGATTTAIGFASIPTAGVVIPTTQTVRQYLRWQLAFAGGMTTCTFLTAFMRAY